MIMLYFRQPSLIFEAHGPSGKMTQSVYSLQRKSEPYLSLDINLQLAESPTRAAETIIHDRARNLTWCCLLASRVTSWTGGGDALECVCIAAYGLPGHSANHSETNFNLMWRAVSKDISAALIKAAPDVSTNVKFDIAPGGDAPA